MAFKMGKFNPGMGTGMGAQTNLYKKEANSMYKKDDKFVENNPNANNPENKKNNNPANLNKEVKKKPVKKSDPYAEALKRDSNLPSYIKKRKTLKKGTPEWNANQNRINKAYGKGPMRDVKTETKSNDRKTVTKTSTPGVSDIKVKTKDTKVKTTTTDHIKGTVTKDKVKAGKDKKIGTDDDKKKSRTRKKFAETKFGKSKLGQKFVKKENKIGGMNASPNKKYKKK
jgi:hypothetical protein